MDEIKTPKEDVAKTEVMIIEEANIEIKALIVESIKNEVPKEELEKQLKKVIENYTELLNESPEIQELFNSGIKVSTQRWYKYYTENIKTINYMTLKQLAGAGIKVPNLKITFSKADVFRPYVANNKKGLAIIENYEKQVRKQLQRLSIDNPTATIIDRNGKVRKVNLRNQAETYVRLKANADDLNSIREKNIKLVITTSHADCSKRCQKWQGRIFSTDKTSGNIDGKRYIPIEEAMKGENGDGNGIISGYNCRHRAIPYKSGMVMPTEYTEAEIRKEREIDSKQRYYERNIRRLKIEEKLLTVQDYHKEAEEVKLRYERWNRNYEIFSHKNGRAFYRWRTEL